MKSQEDISNHIFLGLTPKQNISELKDTIDIWMLNLLKEVLSSDTTGFTLYQITNPAQVISSWQI